MMNMKKIPFFVNLISIMIPLWKCRMNFFCTENWKECPAVIFIAWRTSSGFIVWPPPPPLWKFQVWGYKTIFRNTVWILWCQKVKQVTKVQESIMAALLAFKLLSIISLCIFAHVTAVPLESPARPNGCTILMGSSYRPVTFPIGCQVCWNPPEYISCKPDGSWSDALNFCPSGTVCTEPVRCTTQCVSRN